MEIGALKESDVRLKKHDDEDDYKKDDDLNIEDYDDDWDWFPCDWLLLQIFYDLACVYITNISKKMMTPFPCRENDAVRH